MAAARVSLNNRSQSVVAYSPPEFPVELVFDTWTPRPHFIVVQRQKNMKATDAELQATYELIGRFLLEYSQFNQEAILSFHCGTWYQKSSSHWHAHLCVPGREYKALACPRITETLNNKEWAGAGTFAEAFDNWHDKKMKDYQRYKKDCLEKASRMSSRVDRLSLSTFDSNEFSLVWTSPAPRIGVVRKSSTGTSTLASLYAFMTNFRVAAEKELVRLDPKFANFGCHLCLFVCGQNGTAVTEEQCRVLPSDGEIGVQQSNIVGYIQMDETQYVQWLPGTLRQIWLDEFARADHFVRT